MTTIAQRADKASAGLAPAALKATPKVEPLTCSIGAEISNINLGIASRDPELMEAIRRLLLTHKVLFLRDQDITRAEHIAFARYFGDLEDHPVAGSDPDHPGLVRIYKSPDAPNDRYENAWHSDASWREKPPFGCVLRCVECPEIGGDTMWTNMALHMKSCRNTSRRRSPAARATVSKLHSAPQCRSKTSGAEGPISDAEHPVVRTHPETKEKILFVNGFTTHFTNYHTAANVRYGPDYAPGAAQLLQYLISQAQIPEYQVRWRWKPNSIAFWDNRVTQHYAVMDYPPSHRKMERAGIKGDATF
jgi:taurine dioxygenase